MRWVTEVASEQLSMQSNSCSSFVRPRHVMFGSSDLAVQTVILHCHDLRALSGRVDCLLFQVLLHCLSVCVTLVCLSLSAEFIAWFYICCLKSLS